MQLVGRVKLRDFPAAHSRRIAPACCHSIDWTNRTARFVGLRQRHAVVFVLPTSRAVWSPSIYSTRIAIRVTRVGAVRIAV